MIKASQFDSFFDHDDDDDAFNIYLFFFVADLYPWHPCLDETTNCYYYWNVETNEVQWEPPPQLLAVADAQTTNDSKVTEEENNVEFEYNKEEERQEDEESMYQRNGNFDTYKGIDYYC